MLRGIRHSPYVTVERIPTRGRARSLAWSGDDLVDVLGGWRRWSRAGVETPSRVAWAFPFDQVVTSPSGRYRVLYAERGTKALLIDGDTVTRELNRSFYHATDFDYPVALGRLPDGREVLVHCPEHYNELEVEDLESGQPLTSGPRTPRDVFHSRLSVSPDGRHLLSAGWVWHPYGVGCVYDLERALADSSTLDGLGVAPLHQAVDAEVESACWSGSDRIVMATSAEEPLDGGQPDTLGPGQLGVWSITAAAWLHRSTVAYRVGTMVGCGSRVVALHGYPRLLDPTTGEVVAGWPDIDTGTKDASYGVTHVPTPIVAPHPDGSRLAIAQSDHIAIVQLPDE